MKKIAIKENHLYNKTFKKGKCFVGKYIAVYVLKDLAANRLKKENPMGTYVNRLGLSVSKKIGGAVVRNRAKRIIRAGFDAHADSLKTGFLIVISARTSIVGKTSLDIEKELGVGFSRLCMYKADRDATENAEIKP